MDIEKWKAVCAAATKGPWRFDSWQDGEDGYAFIAECDVLSPTGIQHVNDYEGYWHDWRFICVARTALPEAIAEIERLRAEVERLKCECVTAPGQSVTIGLGKVNP